MDTTYYLTYDLPIPYRSIKIYPVTVKDYLFFMGYSEVLTMDKNVIPDPKVISMTELEYLYYTVESQDNQEGGTGVPYLFQFDRILSMCLKEDDSFESLETSLSRYKKDDKGKPFFVIGKEKFTTKDITPLKEIIAKQNLLDLPDPNISEEVRRSLEEAKKYKEKLSGSKPGSFEDYMISVSVITGWTLEYIYSMSIRKFIKSIRRLDNLVHYKIYLSASMSGFVDFKDKSFIKHWLTDLDNEDKYGDVSVDLDEMRGKISLESAK